MESMLEKARSQIMELKAELENERKRRKKVEFMNKKLVKQERRGREAMEKLCQQLAYEASSHKAEINRLKKEMEEERKMLHLAEVLREERVQMKLTEAKFLLEEKISELATTKKSMIQESLSDSQRISADQSSSSSSSVSGSDSNGGSSSQPVVQRKASPTPENPHIKRGNKGFVEFPKVVKAIGCKSRHPGTKLECQKAQLVILMKHKTPISSCGLSWN